MWEAIQGLVGFEETECIVFVAERNGLYRNRSRFHEYLCGMIKVIVLSGDNAPQLNKVVRKSPPIYFDLSGFSSAHAELRYCRVMEPWPVRVTDICIQITM